MTERPTPRTDAVLNTFNGVASTLAANLATHAEELERELAEAKEQRDRLAERIESLRNLCTTDHESKAAFIDRVNAILYPPNTPDQPPP